METWTIGHGPLCPTPRLVAICKQLSTRLSVEILQGVAGGVRGCGMGCIVAYKFLDKITWVGRAYSKQRIIILANVIKFPGGDHSIAEGVEDNAIEEINEIQELIDNIDVDEIVDILIVTKDKNGDLLAHANNLTGSKLIWMLERVKHTVMLMEDENVQ